MINSLYTAATGMWAQQFKMDTVSNNIANVDTAGYKKVKPEFQDLIYSYSKNAGAATAQNSITPTGIYVGHGTKLSATTRIFTEGNTENTGNALDLAISGDGFSNPTQDGSAYTRDGQFKIDNQGQIVTANGLLLSPALVVPQNASSMTISPDGIVSVELADGTTQQLGTITLTRFVNPAGLKSMGDNLYLATNASGDPIERCWWARRLALFSRDMWKNLTWMSSKMVDMISAMRAYEFNSRSIMTADQMLQTASSLRR